MFRGVKQPELLYTSEGYKLIQPLWNSAAWSRKFELMYTVWTNNSALKYIPQKILGTYIPGKMCINCDDPKLENNCASTVEGMGEQAFSPKRLYSKYLGFVGHIQASQAALVVKNLPAHVGDLREVGSIPGLGRCPEEGHCNPLQYSCLENPHG